MKFPALALAASFASGIVAERFLATAFPATAALFIVAAGIILFGFAAVRLRQTKMAWMAAVLAWSVLGVAAAHLERTAVADASVTALVATGQLNLDQPLRWQGTLRADPLDLPWGVRYQLDLETVQSAGVRKPVSGGLRTDYYFPDKPSSQLPALRAGDRITLLARARTVRNFGNPGSFDYRAFLARQDVHLTSTVRNAELIEKLPGAPLTVAHRFARWRGSLLRATDQLFAASDARAAVVRAMLLGDRSFLDTEQVEAFQQTGAYHILVLSGLQVGVLAALLLWLTRRLRLPALAGIALTIAALWGYAGIVEDQPPILRAVWMATIYLLAFCLFRRTHVLNALGLAALILLAVRPSDVSDASFLLSFLAVATIGGIAAPCLERTAVHYLRALDHLGDLTTDASHPPRAAQFRLDLRAATNWVSALLPKSMSGTAGIIVTAPCRLGLWLWEAVVISAAIQLAMLPLMAQYFHRVSVLGLAANVPAVLLTGAIVPLGLPVAGRRRRLAAAGTPSRLHPGACRQRFALVGADRRAVAASFVSRAVSTGGPVGGFLRRGRSFRGDDSARQAPGFDRHGRAGRRAGQPGCDLPFCGAVGRATPGDYDAGRRPGRLHLRGLPRRQDHAARRRRLARQHLCPLAAPGD